MEKNVGGIRRQDFSEIPLYILLQEVDAVDLIMDFPFGVKFMSWTEIYAIIK